MQARGAAASENVRRTIPAAAHERMWHAADGHAIRLIDWPQPDPQIARRGAMLFMPGRGDAYEKYLETFEHLRGRGWNVGAADWRGQAGSGRLGLDSVTGHVADFAHWVEDVAGLWREWVAEKAGARIAFGHSMGGHLMLRAVAEGVLDPAPDALILSTPMLGVHPEWLPPGLQSTLSALMARMGDARRPAWKWSEKPGEFPAGRQQLLTHDAERYADEAFWRAQRPDLVMGPGSWGWVASSMRSMAWLRHAGVLERIEMPVLVLSTDADRLVSHRANVRAAARMPQAELCAFGEEAAHEILRELDPVRQRALACIDNFLDKVAAS